MCRRTTVNDNVSYTGEGRGGHHEPRGEQLRVVQPLGGCLDGQRFELAPIHDGRHSDPRHVLTVQVVESEPNNQTHNQRRQGKALTAAKDMRSRRVVLNGNPNHNVRTSTSTSTYCGKTAPVPVHKLQSWRNPGGPIGSPAGHKATGYAVAKSDHAGKHASANGRAGGNVRCQHPYARNKHSTKATAKGRNPSKQNYVQQSSLHRTSVQFPSKQEPAHLGTSNRQGHANKTKGDARSNVLLVPVRGRRRSRLETWHSAGDVHKLPYMVSFPILHGAATVETGTQRLSQDALTLIPFNLGEMIGGTQ